MKNLHAKFQVSRFSDLGCALTPVYLSHSPSSFEYIDRLQNDNEDDEKMM